MRVIVVGLGIQGRKREAIAGKECVATVDTLKTEARYRTLQEVPLADYDAALVCTPDEPKYEILKYLLSNKKHVLVEKPLLTESEGQLVELKALSEKNKATAYTAYNHRFEPHIVNLKKAIDGGELGKLHFAEFFYGNGTARDVRNSLWRDKDSGVLPDLGSHLLDMAMFLFGDVTENFVPYSFDCFENKSYDRVLFGSKSGEPRLTMQATLLSWRNTFRADVYGEGGSAHIDCLCKWGPSRFTQRKRVLPSGRPEEKNEVLEMKDPTWALEYDYFKDLCTGGGNNLANDLLIRRVLKKLSASKGVQS